MLVLRTDDAAIGGWGRVGGGGGNNVLCFTSFLLLSASIPKQLSNRKRDGNHREANAERTWTYIRQFQFRRMNADAYSTLAKLRSATNS